MRLKTIFNTALLLVALLLGATLVSGYYQIRRQVRSQAEAASETQLGLLARLVHNYLRISDYAEIRRVVEGFTAGGDVCMMQVTNEYGDIIFTWEKRPTCAPSATWMRKKRLEDEITKGQLGEIMVAFVNPSTEAAVAAQFRTNAGLLTLLLALVFGLTILASRTANDFVSTMSAAFERLLNGDTTPVPVESRVEELAALTRSFNTTLHRFSEFRRKEREQDKWRSIAAMTQMMAHDVRKPFSLLRLGLDLIASGRDVVVIRQTVARLKPAVSQALAHADQLIGDVMEIGATAAPSREPQAIRPLIEASLAQEFRYRDVRNVRLSYRLEHRRKLLVDGAKVLRVMSNIVGNAAQAVGVEGRIWITTAEDPDDMLRITIGNSGSLIPPEDLLCLFDSFFTKGKRGGTGLGLAIAHKVVTDHGGHIWCTSTLESGTEFHFVLPAAFENDSDDIAHAVDRIELPVTGEGIRSTFLRALHGEHLDNRST